MSPCLDDELRAMEKFQLYRNKHRRLEREYLEIRIVPGRMAVTSKIADIEFVDTGRPPTGIDVSALRDEVEEEIQPNTNPPMETMERM
ncbi:MAG TPA: hypothetical protein VMU60_00490 [Syntrophobacteria bacterium]|nr:hypothetical protein [Syntrophobacteria bacterium]